MARGFNQATVATLRAALGADATVSARAVVGPKDDLAALAVAEGICLDAGIGAHVGGRGVGHCRVVLALVVTAHQYGATASITRSIHTGSKQAHVVAGDGNLTARLRCTCPAGIYHTRHAHGARLGIAKQADAAMLVVNTVGLDNASVVDGTGQ